MTNLLIFTKHPEASRIKALEAYNGARNYIFVHSFVHRKNLDSGGFLWISLDRRAGERQLVCSSYRTLMNCAGNGSGCGGWI